MNTEHNNVCWFCGKRPADPDSVLEVALKKELSYAYDRKKKVETAVVSIPRCEFCRSVHRTDAFFFWGMKLSFPIGFFLGGLLGRIIDPEIAFGSGLLLSLVLFIIAFILWIMRWFIRPRGVKRMRAFWNYPVVEELFPWHKGWNREPSFDEGLASLVLWFIFFISLGIVCA